MARIFTLYIKYLTGKQLIHFGFHYLNVRKICLRGFVLVGGEKESFRLEWTAEVAAQNVTCRNKSDLRNVGIYFAYYLGGFNQV